MVSKLQFPNGTGKEVPYQIVFQATKGHGDGKMVERAAPAAATTGEATPASGAPATAS
jgi:hypothetical protein